MNGELYNQPQLHFKQRLKANKISVLSDSIQELCAAMESEKTQAHSITKISTRFNIKRRRLYDVINVLIATGCCQKGEFDTIIWLGKDHITAKIKQYCSTRLSGIETKTLSELFPVESCVGVPNLTVNFLLIYYALETNCLDLRIIATLFSRGTMRMKTTLSKLYQISYILCSIGVCKRNSQVCEVVLEDIFFKPIINQKKQTLTYDEEHPLSLGSLLNRPAAGMETESLLAKREEFNRYFTENSGNADFVQQF